MLSKSREYLGSELRAVRALPIPYQVVFWTFLLGMFALMFWTIATGRPTEEAPVAMLIVWMFGLYGVAASFCWLGVSWLVRKFRR